MDIEISKKEVYRYLGMTGAGPDPEETDPQFDREVDECIRVIREAAVPRCSIRRFPIRFPGGDEDGPAKDVLFIGPLRVESHTLARHLRGCSEAVIFAATIGIEVDRLIRRAQVSMMARAMILQAAGAAAVEAYCDRIEEDVVREAQERGFGTRTRYSPGYGDFPIEHQPKILSLLDASRKTGITLTDGYLMIPSKSVTAVIGIYDPVP